MNGEKWMKAIFFGLMVFSLSSIFTSCKNHKDPNKAFSKFFIVRHAERYPGFNGHLTWYGRLRAGDLMRKLKDSGIQKIYLTPYSRTVETADSLIALQKTDTCVYLLDTAATGLMQQLKSNKDFGKTILIIGHSNTIPDIIRKLGGEYAANTLPDSIFNEIFELINDHGKVQLRTIPYGEPNLPYVQPTMTASDSSSVK